MTPQPQATITIIASSWPYQLQERSTLSNLLHMLSTFAQPAVVQLNEAIRAHESFTQMPWYDRSQLEIFTQVGGIRSLLYHLSSLSQYEHNPAEFQFCSQKIAQLDVCAVQFS